MGALTLGNIAILNDAAARAGCSLRFDIAGWGDELDYRNLCDKLGSQIHAGAKQLFTPASELNKLVASCDIVVDIGAGDSFSDIYGSRRFVAMSLVRLSVLLRKKPLVLAPQTIGPFSKPINRWLAQFIMKKCSRVFARDGLSANVLREAGGGERSSEALDVAFRLPFSPGAKSQTTSSQTKVGLNISALLYNGGYDGGNQFGLSVDYPALSRRLLKSLTQDPRFEVHLVPHVLSAAFRVEDDYLLASSLKEEFPSVVLPEPFKDPVQAKSYISGLDLLIGSRMHATIAAFSSGVPVLPLAYSRKFKGLFDSLNYPLVADLTVDDEERVVERVQYALTHITELGESVAAGNKIADEKLSVYSEYMTDVFRRLSTGDRRLAS